MVAGFLPDLDQDWFYPPGSLDDWEVEEGYVDLECDEGFEPYAPSLSWSPTSRGDKWKADVFSSSSQESTGFNPGGYKPVFEVGRGDSELKFEFPVHVPETEAVSENGVYTDDGPILSPDDEQVVRYTPHVPLAVAAVEAYIEDVERPASDVAWLCAALIARFCPDSWLPPEYTERVFPAYIASYAHEFGDCRFGTEFLSAGTLGLCYNLMQIAEGYLVPESSWTMDPGSWWFPSIRGDNRWRLISARLIANASTRDGYPVTVKEVHAYIRSARSHLTPLSPRLQPVASRLRSVLQVHFRDAEKFRNLEPWFASIGLSVSGGWSDNLLSSPLLVEKRLKRFLPSLPDPGIPVLPVHSGLKSSRRYVAGSPIQAFGCHRKGALYMYKGSECYYSWRSAVGASLLPPAVVHDHELGCLPWQGLKTKSRVSFGAEEPP